MTHETLKANFEALGRNNALEAIDQVATYGNLEGSLDSYFENLGDTLNDREARIDHCEAAYEGFRAVLIAHGITYRPHGL